MWTKLDDGFPDHPKVTACGPLAAWLYVCGLCYTNRLLTDGFIPAGQLRRLADVPDAEGLAEKLCEVGLWERAEGGYSVHDFHDLNPTAEEVKAHRAEVSRKRSDAGKRGMASRWGDNKITKGITNEYQSDNNADNKTITPTYTHPDPIPDSTSPPISPPSGGAPTRGAVVVADNFEQFWQEFKGVYPAREGKRVGIDTVAKQTARALSSKHWDSVLQAARHYADSGRLPVDPVRFFKSRDYPNGMWREWIEPPSRSNGNGNGNGKPNRIDATNEYLGQLFNAGGNGAGASITPVDRPRLR